MSNSISVKTIRETVVISFIEAVVLWPLMTMALLRLSGFTLVTVLGCVFFIMVGLSFPIYPLVECLKCFNYDCNTSLIFDHSKKQISYCRQSVCEVFSLDDIQSCSLVSSRSLAVSSYYLEIKLKSGKIICLTSLLKDVPDIVKATNQNHYFELFLHLPKNKRN